MCNILFDYINPNQHIMITKESEMGKLCHTYEILKRIANEKGFQKNIYEDDNSINNQELYDLLCSKQKVLK